MRGAGLLLLGLLCGCITKALWTAPSEPKPPRLAGEAECDLDLVAPTGDRTLAFAVTPPATTPPRRMKTELGRGRTCLLLRNPYSLSFAGACVLKGETPFRPERINVNFAQTRTQHGTRRDPALLRIEGALPGAMASRIERCEEPAGRRTLEEVRDLGLRVQLGHGIDVLVSLAHDPRPTDVVAWCGVEGPAPDWRAALDLARAMDSLAPLDPYRVVVRRWRDGGSACYRLRLADVVLAAQMSFAGGRYTWEGLWISSLELPKGPATASAGIPSRLRYTEYREEGKGSDVAWRVALTPLALAADYGIASLDDWIEGQDTCKD